MPANFEWRTVLAEKVVLRVGTFRQPEDVEHVTIPCPMNTLGFKMLDDVFRSDSWGYFKCGFHGWFVSSGYGRNCFNFYRSVISKYTWLLEILLKRGRIHFENTFWKVCTNKKCFSLHPSILKNSKTLLNFERIHFENTL